MPNAELAYQVLDAAAEADRLDMDMWAYSETGGLVTLGTLRDPNSCGTSACFAGWTAAFKGFKVAAGTGETYDAQENYVGRVDAVAADLLDIPLDLAAELFSTSSDRDYREDGDGCVSIAEVAERVEAIFGARPPVASSAGPSGMSWM